MASPTKVSPRKPSSAAPAADPGLLTARLAARICAETRLCGELEVAADRLPEIDAEEFRRLAVALRASRGQPSAQALREALALGAIEREGIEGADAMALLAGEEQRDGDAALELAEALDSAATAGGETNADALGYLMRHYFESRRRHLAWRSVALGAEVGAAAAASRARVEATGEPRRSATVTEIRKRRP